MIGKSEDLYVFLVQHLILTPPLYISLFFFKSKKGGSNSEKQRGLFRKKKSNGWDMIDQY